MGSSSLVVLIVILTVSNFLLVSAAQTSSFRPRALILPVKNDASTHQYLTRLSQRTPLVPLILVVDLGAEFMWVNCQSNYVSSSYRLVDCRSASCPRYNGCGICYGPPGPDCNNNTCGYSAPFNPFIPLSTVGNVSQDVVSLASTDGSNPGPSVVMPRFTFVCGSNIILPGLATGATGMVGLGRSTIGTPLQFAAAFSFQRTFAVCLPSSTGGVGVIFFGNGPYNLLPNVQISQSLTYTPLYINPVSTASSYAPGERSVEYFIGVRSITIGEHRLRINNTLLTIDRNGDGGTKISTVDRFTLLETSIYRAFTAAFIREAAARNISRVVPGIAPFDVCFSTRNVFSTRVGPSVPGITLAVNGQNSPVWTITGSNSMVQVNDEVLCLGFMDGGANPRTAIVIGGFQIEDNLLQFDLSRSRLGFSTSLLWRRTTCSNFNFTATP